jgi:hypothetical protein
MKHSISLGRWGKGMGPARMDQASFLRRRPSARRHRRHRDQRQGDGEHAQHHADFVGHMGKGIDPDAESVDHAGNPGKG